jgi:hypothetical protein
MREKMRKGVLIAMLVGVLGVSGAAVSATPLSKMMKDSGLTPQDFELLGAAESTLYDNKTPAVGASQSWKNPDSLSFGTVKVEKVEQSCIILRHDTHPKGAEASFGFNKRMCKSTDGRWLITP